LNGREEGNTKYLEQLLTIELFGQPYTFKTDSDLTKAKEVADILVREVNRVEAQQKKTGTGITKNAMLILAALNIAAENLELNKKQADFIENVSQRADTVMKLMERK
jgi:cell division protein ZapA (FtsZ GTPase activity inhibitor)